MVKSRVLSVDAPNNRMKLSLRTSKAAARATLVPGSIVTCTISGVERERETVLVDIKNPDEKSPPLKGVVPFIHLSDHAEVCKLLENDADAVEARFPPGTNMEYDAIVVESARALMCSPLKTASSMPLKTVAFPSVLKISRLANTHSALFAGSHRLAYLFVSADGCPGLPRRLTWRTTGLLSPATNLL